MNTPFDNLRASGPVRATLPKQKKWGVSHGSARGSWLVARGRGGWLAVALTVVPGAARAWDYTEVTDGDCCPPIFPVGSAIRQFGPTDQVYIVSDRRTDIEYSDDDLHKLQVFAYTCSDGDTCATATIEASELVGETVRFDEPLHPSIAVGRGDPSDPVTLHSVFRQKVEQDCDSDAVEYDDLGASDGGNVDAYTLDLHEVAWQLEASPRVVGTWTVAAQLFDAGRTCRDHQVSHQRRKGAYPYAVWNTVSRYGDSFIEGGNRAPWGWLLDTQIDVSGSSGADQPWFDFRSDDRFMAAHVDDSVQVHFLDEWDDPHVEFPTLTTDTRWPSLEVSAAGRVRLAWGDGPHAQTNAVTFQYSECGASEDCLDSSDWISGLASQPTARQHEVEEAPDALHAQLAVDGSHQFLLGMIDPAGNGQNFGVYLMDRCGSAAWSAPELVKTRLDVGNDQSIANGVPNLVLNKEEGIVHVVFTEHDDYVDPSFGVLFWARRSYSPCN